MGSGFGDKRSGSAFLVVKYSFIAFNILVWLLGFGVLSVGVWMQVNRAPYSTLLPNANFLSATAICIAVGCIIFIVGFTGCCGAILESQCMLVVYFVFVLVIFGLEVAATALAFTHSNEMEQFIHEEVRLSIRRDYSPDLRDTANGGVVAIVDSIQTDLQCCGIDNLTDWYYIQAWPHKQNVPASCCVNPAAGCGMADSKAALYSRGCLNEVEYWLHKNMYTLGVLALVVAVVQVLAMTAAVCMFCCLKTDKYLL